MASSPALASPPGIASLPLHDYRRPEDLPVLDRKGHLRHHGGVVDAPGVYAMGLPFLRRRKSSFLHGADDDARELSAHLAAYLAGASANGGMRTRSGAPTLALGTGATTQEQRFEVAGPSKTGAGGMHQRLWDEISCLRPSPRRIRA
ncbi:hypothetical protein [Halomonas cerina]|uniref:Uncharacterized protein n=1 Tax=Halomonas cerina TaxID=447424 RepID=A0A839VA26_9GAMM|nr:hypothetical protein [Halomonas cerina]MBB3192483.1 hypothetical protein [Halomonas cerina]